ncbi:hypothetical protein GOP47_0022900 [Adiantum capillus-veneris]|uniref:E3 ubiquitin-protein ligase n=1 Tax=Adiantum capillus-veneris TaxID=13818 RepID=A0A9D4U6A8_ADICA|nr:hypothetical protein GOP47_0022900 [Adiantum capillus-veneris]
MCRHSHSLLNIRDTKLSGYGGTLTRRSIGRALLTPGSYCQILLQLSSFSKHTNSHNRVCRRDAFLEGMRSLCGFMASSRIDLNLVLSHSDTHPLLMDQDTCNEPHNIVRSAPIAQAIPNEHSSFHSLNLPSHSPQENTVGGLESPIVSPVSAPSQAHLDYPAVNSIGRSSSSSSRLQLIPRTSLLRTSSSGQQRRESSRFNSPQRSGSLNSGLWISFEVAITLSQIIASIIVLALSRDEKPKAPLALWIIGYTAGCVAILPLLYWRYRQRHARHQEDDVTSVSVASSSHTSNSPRTSQSVSQHNTQVEDLERGLPISDGPEVANRGSPRYHALGNFMLTVSISLTVDVSNVLGSCADMRSCSVRFFGVHHLSFLLKFSGLAECPLRCL